MIRVFPAIPGAWQDLTVHDFRTPGAFLLSAVRRGGRTRWVRLCSEAGAPCVVERTSLGGSRGGRPGRPLPRTGLGGGRIGIWPERGGEALIHPEGATPDLTVTAVRHPDPGTRWGLLV
ncbi:hypothetical protein [Streptomyces sp. NPDC002133]|uniref:hypothetical protein n=1 Tax=Streptomyces sp. NPDC002133 TaxID=3154409 RepID=UPI003321EB96